MTENTTTLRLAAARIAHLMTLTMSQSPDGNARQIFLQTIDGVLATTGFVRLSVFNRLLGFSDHLPRAQQDLLWPLVTQDCQMDNRTVTTTRRLASLEVVDPAVPIWGFYPDGSVATGSFFMYLLRNQLPDEVFRALLLQIRDHSNWALT